MLLGQKFPCAVEIHVLSLTYHRNEFGFALSHRVSLSHLLLSRPLELICDSSPAGMVADHIRQWTDLVHDSLLYIVVNADLAFDYPKPLFPNVISVEAPTAQNAKPLPAGVRACECFCENRASPFDKHVKLLSSWE